MSKEIWHMDDVIISLQLHLGATQRCINAKYSRRANHIKCILVSSIAILKKTRLLQEAAFKLWNLFSSSPRLAAYGATVLELRHDYYETLLELRRSAELYKKCSILKQGIAASRFARIIIIIIHKHFKARILELHEKISRSNHTRKMAEMS